MKINLPREAKSVIDILEKKGFEAYLVGGCVRDGLLGLEPDDWDIVTSAKPQEIKNSFAEFRLIETGIKYGTITVIIEQKPIEITTYRVEGTYSDNRHPDKVHFVKNLKEDLSRRDFTINALAYHPEKGLIDYFDGLLDLKQRVIRSVGDPEERFKEDSLRIMRAMRFAATYEFVIDAQTAKAMKEHKGLLKNIAVERNRMELDKLLCGDGVKKVLRKYVHVVSVIIPELLPMVGFNQHNPHHHLDVWKHTLECVAHAPKQIIPRLVMLFHDIGKPHCFTQDDKGIGHFYGHNRISVNIAKKVLTRLKYDHATLEQVQLLILYHDAQVLPEPKYVKRWLNRLGEDNFRLLLEVKKADTKGKNPRSLEEKLKRIENLEHILRKIIEEKQCFSLKHLEINGHDLLQSGIPRGKNIGVILDRLLKKVINEEIENDKEKLLSSAKNIYSNLAP